MKVRKSVFISALYLSLAIIGYIFTPRQMEFSMTLYVLTVSVAVGALIYYYKHRKKSNYLDFDTLFIVTCYMIGFISSFFYGKVFYKALFFFEFNYSYLNSGAWLFTIGMTSYFLGGLSFKNTIIKLVNENCRILPTKPIFILVTFLMLMFIVTGGISFYKNYYMGDKTVENGIASYLLLLISILVIILFSTEFLNKSKAKNYSIHKLYILVTLGFSVLLLYSGNRTQALLLILPIIGLYAYLFRPIFLREFVYLIIPAIIGMWIVQNLRSYNKINTSLESPALVFLDMTIPSRSTYESMEYVDNNGITFGKSMSASVIGLIPGLAGVIMDGNINEYGSAETLSEYTFNKLNTPKEYQIGLGTNTIADIYLAFGIVGTIILMFFLARIIRWFELKTLNLSIYGAVGFSALLANSVFLARSSYTHPIRYVVWSIILVGIYKTLIHTSRKNKLL